MGVPCSWSRFKIEIEIVGNWTFEPSRPAYTPRDPDSLSKMLSRSVSKCSFAGRSLLNSSKHPSLNSVYQPPEAIFVPKRQSQLQQTALSTPKSAITLLPHHGPHLHPKNPYSRLTHLPGITSSMGSTTQPHEGLRHACGPCRHPLGKPEVPAASTRSARVVKP